MDNKTLTHITTKNIFFNINLAKLYEHIYNVNGWTVMFVGASYRPPKKMKRKNAKKRPQKMKTPTLNIYINEETKKKLNKFCKTHHISYSTCIEKLVLISIQIQKQLTNEYLTKGNKTSVKVNSFWDNKLSKEEKAKLYTNLIYLYFNKKLNTYFEDTRWKQLQKVFIDSVEEAEDQYYSYNEHIRNEARMLNNKSMREYLKRKLAQYEQN